MVRSLRECVIGLLPIVLVLGARLSQGPAVAQGPPATPTGGPPLAPRFFEVGWNLIGVTGDGAAIPTVTPLYTLTPDGAGYRAVRPVDSQRGVGYWAYFPAPVGMLAAPNPLCDSCPALPSIPLPAGQWVMIGDPYTSPTYITVHGADVVYTYDTLTEQYQQTTQLTAGQGAFAYSTHGGQLTFSR